MTARTPFRDLVWLGASHFPGLISFWMLQAWTTLVLVGEGRDPGWIGVFAALPWVGVLCIVPLAPQIRRALGWRGSYQFGNILGIFSTAGFFVNGNFWVWCGLAFVTGLSVALRWIIGDAWASAMTPLKVQGRMVGAFETLAGSAIGIGPALVALTGLEGWVPGVVLVGLMVLASGAGFFPAEPVEGGLQATKPSQLVNGALIIGVLVFAGGLLESGYVSLLPVFGIARGLDPAGASLLMAVCNFSALFLQWPLGWLADHFGPVKVTLASAGITVLAALGVAMAGGGAWLFVAVFVWGGSAGAFYTLGRIMIIFSNPGNPVPVMSSLAFFYTLGAMCGPLVSGPAMSLGGAGGYAMTLVISAAVVAGFCGVFLRKQTSPALT